MIRTVGDFIRELERFPKDLLIFVDRFESNYHISDKWNIESVDVDTIKINESSVPFLKITPYDGLEQILSECKCEIGRTKNIGNSEIETIETSALPDKTEIYADNEADREALKSCYYEQ